jgi:ligand-binding sensor domain-containing protein
MKRFVPTFLTILFLSMFCNAQDLDVKLDKINPAGWPFVWTLTMDADSNLYAGDVTGKIFTKAKGENEWTQDLTFDLGSTEVRGISVYGKDDIWVCTKGKGMARFDGATWIEYNSTNGWKTDEWYKSVRDNSGSTWCMSREAGVAKLSGPGFNFFDETNSKLKSSRIADIIAAKDGTVWIASYEQVLSFKNGVWKDYDLNALFGYSSAFINSLYEDATGRIWACTYKGLFVFENNGWVSRQSISGEKEVQVMAIDKKGSLWYLQYGTGLVRYTSNSKKTFEGTTSNAIPSQAWVMLVNSKNEKLLVGNKGANMIVVNDDALSTATTEAGYEDIVIYPNPGTEYLYIKDNAGLYKYSIYNALGQNVHQGAISDGRIDLTPLATGSYNLRLQGNGKQYKTTFTKI